MSLLDNDLIHVNVKRPASRRIKQYYCDFGWKLKEEKDDKKYIDLVHLTFSRPHSIDHKDELCLLQVRLELAMNRIGINESKKKTRALAIGNILGLISLALTICGICLTVFVSGIISLIGGIATACIGVALGVWNYFLTKKIYKSDKEKYQKLINTEIETIKGYCDKARSLRGQYE